MLTVTQMLRKKGVVDKFVEFYGAGIGALSLPDRATIANMAPEYGATMGFFPVDDETLAYLRFTGRTDDHVAARRALLQGEPAVARPDARSCGSPTRCRSISSTVEPSLAGPTRPQDRVPLKTSRRAWRKAVGGILGDKAGADAAAIDAWVERGRRTRRPATLAATQARSRPTRARSRSATAPS